MIFSSWTRLVNSYSARIARLLLAYDEPWERLARNTMFQHDARKVAEAMVAELSAANARSWREAAFKSGHGRKIYEALQAEIKRANLQPYLRQIARENADLISSLPAQIAQQITKHAQRMYQEGRRPAEIEKELQRAGVHITKAHAKLIARTEISKSESQLTEARAKHIQIPAYQWLTSKDVRVRPSHKRMDSVIVLWDDPPNPELLNGEHSTTQAYNAGCIWNCRCVEAPLVSLDEVSWPARVHRNGALVRMSRGQFAAMAGYQ